MISINKHARSHTTRVVETRFIASLPHPISFFGDPNSSSHFIILPSETNRKRMNKNIRLGILTGMGPGSTAPFLEMVYDECRQQYGARYDIDFPEMAIFSWPTPFYIDREIDDDALFTAVKKGLTELDKTQPDIVAIPCNVVHRYFDRLKGGTRSRLLSITEVTQAAIPDDAQKVTVLATPSTMELQLYQNKIARTGKSHIFEETWQNQVNHIIQSIKNNDGRDTIFDRYRRLETEIKAHGVDTVILACTDLSVIGMDYPAEIPIIDSARELARALVREYVEQIV
jgi:aspartate racemase